MKTALNAYFQSNHPMDNMIWINQQQACDAMVSQWKINPEWPCLKNKNILMSQPQEKWKTTFLAICERITGNYTGLRFFSQKRETVIVF